MTLAFTQNDFDELAAPKHFQVQPVMDYTDRLRANFGCTSRLSKNKNWFPEFASNDAQLQAVILRAAVKYCFRDKPVPPGFAADLETVIALAKQRTADDMARAKNSRNIIQQNLFQHLVVVENAGGYVALMGAIAYRSWRLAHPNALVASELGISREYVEGATQVLIVYAEKLGFPTYKHSFQKGEIRVNADDIAAMWVQKKSVKQIRSATGHDLATIRRVLKKFGLKPSQRHRLDADTIVEMYALGACTAEIHRRTGYGKVGILKVLKERGVHEHQRFYKRLPPPLTQKEHGRLYWLRKREREQKKRA